MDSNRARVGGWTLMSLGLALGVVALVSALIPTDSDVGDVASIKSELLAGTAPPSVSTPTSLASTSTTLARSPLWQSNQSSVLGPSAPRGPRPNGLRIGALGVDALVAGYGVDGGTGQMDIPNNATDVAWYEHGPIPGEPGSAVLAAHVDLHRQGPGVFFDLEDLEPDDEVVVTYDNGTERLFLVVARSTYSKEDLPFDVIFSRVGPPVLTLITCGGGFSASTQSYDSNVVVYAVPAESSRGPLQSGL